MASVTLHFILLRWGLSLNRRHLLLWLSWLANNLSEYVSSYSMFSAGVTGTYSHAYQLLT